MAPSDRPHITANTGAGALKYESVQVLILKSLSLEERTAERRISPVPWAQAVGKSAPRVLQVSTIFFESKRAFKAE
jgi:hypothetical protein